MNLKYFKFKMPSNLLSQVMWGRGVVVITTTQLRSTNPELRFCTGSNSTRGESEIHNDEDL